MISPLGLFAFLICLLYSSVRIPFSIWFFHILSGFSTSVLRSRSLSFRFRHSANSSN